MDCTYKKNLYKLSLLVIVGHTCLGTTFYTGFAFLANEKEPAFVWVLETLKDFIWKNKHSFPKSCCYKPGYQSDKRHENYLLTNLPAFVYLACE